MKGLLLIAGVLALACLPVQAGTSVSISIGGAGYHGFSCGSASRCGYSTGCYPYRNCGYGYYGYPYGGYAYAYAPYSYSYGPVSYDVGYIPQSVPPPQAPAQAAATTPAPTASSPPTPPPTPLEFGILDVNGYVHSPYSDALLKIPNVRTAQMVYDPVTGKPFLVR